MKIIKAIGHLILEMPCHDNPVAHLGTDVVGSDIYIAKPYNKDGAIFGQHLYKLITNGAGGIHSLVTRALPDFRKKKCDISSKRFQKPLDRLLIIDYNLIGWYVVGYIFLPC